MKVCSDSREYDLTSSLRGGSPPNGAHSGSHYGIVVSTADSVAGGLDAPADAQSSAGVCLQEGRSKRAIQFHCHAVYIIAFHLCLLQDKV